MSIIVTSNHLLKLWKYYACDFVGILIPLTFIVLPDTNLLVELMVFKDLK